ncbi:hypothetical protein BDR03DRAFT_950021, partial [Suillus americanus]
MICAVVCWSGMLCSLGRVLGRYENLACAEVRSHNGKRIDKATPSQHFLSPLHLAHPRSAMMLCPLLSLSSHHWRLGGPSVRLKRGLLQYIHFDLE